jgi:tRNA (adenine57-N1/adenine58-N1)-methyltransferase
MGTPQYVKAGDSVLILLGRHRYIVKVEEEKKFHTHVGYIDFKDLIGKPYGSCHNTSSGVPYTVLRPARKDYVSKLPRSTQVIYPKDAALITVWADIKPGDRVLEAGTGSGGLTLFLADKVGDNGVVYGYDVRNDSLEKTKRNLEAAGLVGRVDLRLGDVLEGVDQTDLDAVVLDLPTPWLAVESLKRSLKADGHFVSFSPTINQVEKTTVALAEHGFTLIEAFEVIQRFYDAKPGATRPHTVGVVHTGYIVSARNTLASKTQEKSIKVNSALTSGSPKEFFDSVDKGFATNV